MAEVKWIKIATGIFDNRKIKQIEKMPEGDAIIVIWFKILCLAGNINDNGMIYFTKEMPYTEEMLSVEFNKSIQLIKLALVTFQNFGMLEVIDDVLFISSWEKYQNVEGLEKIREQTRKRVAKHRENKAVEDSNNKCNVTVTQSNATDKEREEDKDIKKEEKDIDNKTEKKKEFKIYYPEDELLNLTFLEFIEFRKKIKAPMTDHAVELLIKKLDSMTNENDQKIEILNQSIMNGWKGVFPLKDNVSNSVNKTNESKNYNDTVNRMISQIMEEELNKNGSNEIQELLDFN